MADETTDEAVNTEFPKMIYRGEEQLIVNDAGELDAALGAGFYKYGEHPLDHDGDNRKGGSKPKAKAD